MEFFLSLSKLGFMTIFYCLLYQPINKLLEYNSIYKKYKLRRKSYITKNLIKTVAMFYILINFILIMYSKGLHKFLDNQIIRNYGAIYVGNDIGGLIMVKNLPKSTKFHHIMSFCLYCVVSYVDIEQNDIVRMISIYTIFSFIPYSVNGFLALRFFHKKESNNQNQLIINKFVNLNRVSAKYIYLTTCIMNWLIHLRYFILKMYFNKFYTYHFFYILVLIPIINDDIILLKWLNKSL